ncbi:hypothetical protein LZ017_16975 [Pelomonas sp. CA6]|uniref:hypothetical protein n=1 Tax=Pelomonas sp. CA6 TaxID=2907999 RepID=UPI001F4C4EE0|nr:hypothetical protein [Pelomonas sp. CA6]MCH7345078.1 hypothetical protein [Pelomonas sp. CA6]
MDEALDLSPARQALRLRRAQRARIAERLQRSAPAAAAALSWPALEQAFGGTACVRPVATAAPALPPVWLALPDDALLTLQRRVGAVFCAPALRRWIDAPRVQALRAALGDGFYRALLKDDAWQQGAALPPGLPDWPQQSAPGATVVNGVATLLRNCGAAVLACTLPHGALRHAASQALAPLAELMMPTAHAQALLRRATLLAAPPVPATARRGERADTEGAGEAGA